MARWRRQVAAWVRRSRLGVWLAVLLSLAGVAYGLVRLSEAMRRYASTSYEPKDVERQRHLEGQGGAR